MSKGAFEKHATWVEENKDKIQDEKQQADTENSAAIADARKKIKRLSPDGTSPGDAQTGSQGGAMNNILEAVQAALTPDEQVRLKALYDNRAALQMAGFLSPILGHLLNGGMKQQECMDFMVLNTKAALGMLAPKE